MTIKKKAMSKDEAVAKLWEIGELSWKYNRVQKELDEKVENDTTKISVVVVSRRTGKSYWLCMKALMQCLKKSNSIVKFIFPKQKDAKININPLMREILEDCPKALRPNFNTQDKVWNFHNGSQIQLAGCDNGNIEGIRGGKADLCIVDEAGFCSDLKYAIRSVLSPTIRTTGGKIIMASTPSESPNHDFIKYFMNPYKAEGRLEIFTIYDNPNFTPEIIEEILSDYPDGVGDPDFRREYLCEVAMDAESTICPEFTKAKDDIIIDNYELPSHRDFYTSMDVGFKDLTVALFSYYDFREGIIYIVDELVMNGPSMTTLNLAKELKFKEGTRYFDPIVEESVDPYARIMDNDLKLINDLNALHGIRFRTTAKTNKEAAVNNMRIWVQNKRIKIHSRCKHLIYHLQYGQWDNNRKKFKNLPDSDNKTLKGGHVDAVDSLVYLLRNIQEGRNPYPEGYDMLSGPNVFRRHKPNNEASSFMNAIMNIKKKR